MGSESSNSNSSKSDSDSSSNSADNKNKLETIDCQAENENTIIKRVWIAKKSITITDEHVNVKLRLLLGSEIDKKNCKMKKERKNKKKKI